MEIIWHGHNCFTLKGTDTTIVTDPYGDTLGLKPPKWSADTVTMSGEDDAYNNVSGISGEPKVFDWPGEYESGGALVTLVEAQNVEGTTTLLSHFEIDGIKVCHLGSIGEKLTEEMIEQLGDVDILLVPVGGKDTVDAKTAHIIVEQIDPRMVIPMHYKIEGLKTDHAPIGDFLKEVGSHNEPLEKVVVKARNALSEESTEFVVLEPKLG